jgi:hypothetical protein
MSFTSSVSSTQTAFLIPSSTSFTYFPSFLHLVSVANDTFIVPFLRLKMSSLTPTTCSDAAAKSIEGSSVRRLVAEVIRDKEPSPPRENSALVTRDTAQATASAALRSELGHLYLYVVRENRRLRQRMTKLEKLIMVALGEHKASTIEHEARLLAVESVAEQARDMIRDNDLIVGTLTVEYDELVERVEKLEQDSKRAKYAEE